MSGSHAHIASAENAPTDTPRLSPEQSKKVLTLGAVFAAVGLILSGAAVAVDSTRFAYAWLTGFEFVLTIGLGALCWVIIQHLAKAGWSVAARRIAEWIGFVIPFCALMFVPIAVFAPHLFHEWWTGPGKDDALIAKASYLNPTMFYVRAVLFFAAWIAIAEYYRRLSLRQDTTGDANLTTRMQKWSPPLILITGYTLTFGAAFDWLMSLTPHWYSTIFGIYVFAGGFVSSLAIVAIITVVLQDKGMLRQVSTLEHRYDIGKYVFAFVIFWSYIAFAQFMLIWYANIPEETIFFDHRWHGSWGWVSASLIFGNFLFPFCILLSRTAKKSSFGLVLGSVIVLVFHFVDMFWIVMPNMDPAGVHFGWIELAGLLGPLGVLAFAIAWRASRDAIYPLKDPRLAETMRNYNP